MSARDAASRAATSSDIVRPVTVSQSNDRVIKEKRLSNRLG
jgi:hypothetical protein